MPLKCTSEMVDTGKCHITLPPEAELFEPGMEKTLNQEDYIKVAVISKNGVREIFWAKFIYTEHDAVVAVIKNNLMHTNLHGLEDEEQIVVPIGKIQAVLR